jgi:hypothetical protein
MLMRDVETVGFQVAFTRESNGGAKLYCVRS